MRRFKEENVIKIEAFLMTVTLSSVVVLFAGAFRASYPSGTEKVLRKTSSCSPHAPHQRRIPMNPPAVLGEMSKCKLALPWPYAAASELLHQG